MAVFTRQRARSLANSSEQRWRGCAWIKFFFSSKGFSLERGLTDAHLAEAESKAALIGSGSAVIALVNHNKFTRDAFCQVADLERVDIIITDQAPNAQTVGALGAMDIRLIVANAANV